ncbi:hypothetical protein L6R53_14140 [Myxococcota bacterium]|nr:hypothetical protein [Myxococcota bacterium]
MTWRDLTPWSAWSSGHRDHQLERQPDGRRRCAVCGASWSARPRGHAEHCPGVPLYLRREHVPADLVTATQAAELDLAVTPAPVAALQVLQPGTGDLLRVPLFRCLQVTLW